MLKIKRLVIVRSSTYHKLIVLTCQARPHAYIVDYSVDAKDEPESPKAAARQSQWQLATNSPPSAAPGQISTQ